MSAAVGIDVARLIRIGTLFAAIATAAAIYLTYAPQIDALQQRVDDGENELRSGEIAIAEGPHLRVERERLAHRYAALFAQNSEAVFVRELATTVRRHGVSLLATTVAADTQTPSVSAQPRPSLFTRTRVSIELRGTYRTLLGAIGELSTGSEIVEVSAPTLHRDGDSVVATVPVTIYEPTQAAKSPLAAPASLQK